MRNVAKHLDFELVTLLRDEIKELNKKAGKLPGKAGDSAEAKPGSEF